ncbi:DUF5107 domain-containing protein [Gracilibacillus lacisalsi]|uniref:DUF5107 domain-containing protein n=1 Tax=Gracilibacillus lacisalsi TaxID=393087 RepID=UPI00035DF48D|nr:DUF5107 domain-containing protein [Gracilibacillus lacisalsi]
MNNKVKVWEEKREIPTYEVGKPDKNPMFLEKRVYQGSSGRVYPHPVIDKIYDEKVKKTYQMVILENDFIRVEIMPEIGGRIYRALDKTNNYDFVYYNRVIKPALVGLVGPWISGGIEFNWPQHHRPNTFGPVEYRLEEENDGSAVVWVGEVDRMYGTKVTTGFRLFPHKAYIEIEAQLYNRTSEPQTFLWWANPAVAVNNHTQTVFPPDVNAVMDHGKRDVSRFPIATGTYYKMDYSEGVDISRYKNIPVPTSYMAYKSDYNFVGGYDHGVNAGLLHVADHHISPGKKQWTWGNGEFGQAWDRNLTDEDGPYIELMTGVYTDNQPDFTWLKPYEEKAFKQYFMPYKDIGVVKNASIDAAVNLDTDENKRTVVQAYATSVFEGAKIELKGKNRYYLKESVNLSPTETFKTIVTLDEVDKEHELEVTVKDSKGKVLVSYKPQAPKIEEIPDAAEPMSEPEDLKTNEELYLAGLHLEQYRHATFEPENYYLEGLKRDSKDIRLNVAYGKLILRRGLFEESESYFRKAIQSLTSRNPNPYDSEAYYQLGVTLKFQRKYREAFAAFYKACWSADWQDSGYFSLAQIAHSEGHFKKALEFVNQSLTRNTHNYQARLLKSGILRKLNRLEEAEAFTIETLNIDKMDFGAFNELYLIYRALGEKEKESQLLEKVILLMRGDVHNYLTLADDYQSSGFIAEAIDILQRIQPNRSDDAYPMQQYALAYFYRLLGKNDKSEFYQKAGSKAKPDYCFPNSLFELVVLQEMIDKHPDDSKAYYYLGNLLYDKKRHKEAIKYWEKSIELDNTFATAHRNLSLGYYNKLGLKDESLQALEKAFSCNQEDARVFYELDQLYKKLKVTPAKRLGNFNKHIDLVQARDDLYLEYVTLLNSMGEYEKVLQALQNRIFHPWEGGEGKIPGQYVFANVELGKVCIEDRQYNQAVAYLQQALNYPENLGEGKLAGAQENNIYYYLGCAYEGLNKTIEAKDCFEIASTGLDEPTSVMYYNDQPPEMIYYQGLAWLKLNNKKEAKRRFNKLIDYGETHFYDDVKIEYFAVSLPDFLVFEDDLNQRNKIHCLFMIGLGLLGMQKVAEAQKYFEDVLAIEPNHQGAISHLPLCKENHMLVSID